DTDTVRKGRDGHLSVQEIWRDHDNAIEIVAIREHLPVIGISGCLAPDQRSRIIEVLRGRIRERNDLEFRQGLEHLDMRPGAMASAHNSNAELLLRVLG